MVDRGGSAASALGTLMACAWQYSSTMTSSMFARLRRSRFAAAASDPLMRGSTRKVKVSVLSFGMYPFPRHVSAWREGFFNALVLRDKAQTPWLSMERKPTRGAPRNARAALAHERDEWQYYISGETRMTVFVSVV
jgi:hypothetical protein